MAFSNQEKLNNSDKLPLQLVGTANEAPGTKWAYNEEVGLSFITVPSKIWAEFENIPGAATPALADAAVTANPTLLEKRSVHLTLDPTSNNRAWTARETYGDLNTAIYGDWIQPSLIRDGGSPSPGYAIRLYNGDPGAGGTELPTTYLSGLGGAPSWQWNYSMGVLVVSTDQRSAYGAMDLWVVGYRYIGPTGTGSSSSSIYTYNFTNETTLNVPHGYNSRQLLLKIRDDGTNDYDITGLADKIVYTDLNSVDITFPTAASGTVVVGYYEQDVFEQRHADSILQVNQHTFNKNHCWSIYDVSSFDDLRYMPFYYQYVDAEQDMVEWTVTAEQQSVIVSGFTKKRITVFPSALTTWTFQHNFNSKNVFIACHDIVTGIDFTSMAHSIQYNSNDVTIIWATPQSGRLIVGL